jgi:hypothetical protein
MIRRATVGSGLDYVEFYSSHEAEDLRIRRMAAHDLVILFETVESSELVADLICELHEGTSVTLPGDYSAAQLVLLGYRISAGNHRGMRTFPATDMRNTPRETLPTCP